MAGERNVRPDRTDPKGQKQQGMSAKQSNADRTSAGSKDEKAKKKAGGQGRVDKGHGSKQQ